MVSCGKSRVSGFLCKSFKIRVVLTSYQLHGLVSSLQLVEVNVPFKLKFGF